MKPILFFLLLVLISSNTSTAQSKEDLAPNIATASNPYGKVNPSAYPEVRDYESLIGTCDCKVTLRLPDGTWSDSVGAIWDFKYILDGTAVQDEIWREDGVAASGVRTFNPDSARWSVTYYASVGQPINPLVWEGGKKEDKIVLKRPQKAPNGFDGFSRLTFYDISEEGFKWKGEWASPDGSIVFPFRYITCKKRKE